MITAPTTLEILDLDDPRAADPAVAGTKGAGLARLRAIGQPVPDGVVLPVETTRRWQGDEAPAHLRRVVTSD